MSYTNASNPTNTYTKQTVSSGTYSESADPTNTYVTASAPTNVWEGLVIGGGTNYGDGDYGEQLYSAVDYIEYEVQ